MATPRQVRTSIEKRMQDTVEEAIREVTKKVLDELRDTIIRDVYVRPYPNKIYAWRTGQPTFEFLNTWRWSQIEKTAKQITTTLFHDWESMSVDTENGGYVHGSWEGDARENLADILNLAFNNYQPGYTSGLKWLSAKERRPYWKNFVEKMFEGKQLEKWFNEAFAKRGITPLKNGDNSVLRNVVYKNLEES